MAEETQGFNLKSLSRMLGISVRTLRKYIQKGDLRARKIGKGYYVSKRNLEVFLDPK